MRIVPINNNQPQFSAKLPKSELNNLVDSALRNDKEAGIPKLYTLLDGLDKIQGEKAEIKNLIRNSQSQLIGFYPQRNNSYQLRIDNELKAEGTDTFDVLYSAVTSAKTKDGKRISMPKSVFDLMWWGNKDKTYNDVEQLLRD